MPQFQVAPAISKSDLKQLVRLSVVRPYANIGKEDTRKMAVIPTEIGSPPLPEPVNACGDAILKGPPTRTFFQNQDIDSYQSN